MIRFPCSYLGKEVELTLERERHITERHPDLLPDHRDRIAITLADPDQIRRSSRFARALLFSRWYPDLKNGKHVVVVVINSATDGRCWVVTAYIARRVAEGEAEWVRS